jgi:hypothetical protein
VIKHIRWQILLVFVGVGLLVGLLVFVALNFTTEWVAASGGTYVEGLAGTPQFLNPLLCQTNETDTDLCGLLFNGLTRIDHHGQVVPSAGRLHRTACLTRFTCAQACAGTTAQR